MSITSQLFKFKPLDPYAIDCLVRQRLFLAPWTDLNDANEAQMFIREKRANFHMNPARIRETFPDLLNFDAMHVRVCSLSRVRWSNLLWSHYANCHTGVAIGISLPNDLRGVEQLTVEYDDETPVLDPPVGKTGVMEALRHKSSEWEYEKETRLVSFEKGPSFVEGIEIIDVIVGLRTSNDSVSELKELLPNTVRLWRICRKTGSHMLNAEDIYRP